MAKKFQAPKRRSVLAASLANPIFRPKKVPSKKIYNRKKMKLGD